MPTFTSKTSTESSDGHRVLVLTRCWIFSGSTPIVRLAEIATLLLRSPICNLWISGICLPVAIAMSLLSSTTSSTNRMIGFPMTRTH